jgi:hypothetical protein
LLGRLPIVLEADNAFLDGMKREAQNLAANLRFPLGSGATCSIKKKIKESTLCRKAFAIVYSKSVLLYKTVKPRF